MQGRVLTIAGSDSGGGAGIQADIKTIMALGGYAMTAITAVTVQNTEGVSAVHAVPPDIVAAQIVATVGDIGADVVKTGMLVNDATIAAVADALAACAATVPRVVDPVMLAKGGAAMLSADGIQNLVTRLIAGAAVVTPNLPEAAVLTGRRIETEADMQAAAGDLLALGARAVLLKGGHLQGDRVIDLLITPEGITRFEGARIPGRATHGTGCTLASAVATGLANRMALPDAVAQARAYVRQAMTTATTLGHGHGPLNHGHTVTPFLPD